MVSMTSTFHRFGRIALLAALSYGCLLTASAQETPPPPTAPHNDSYVLGAGDLITIWSLGADEISNKPYTILPDGSLDLPLIGHVVAAGKSVVEFRNDLRTKLGEFFHDPQVSVAVTDFRSQPVSVLGSVNEPGVHQLQGNKTLLEVLSLAGGTAPEADSRAIVTRRAEWGNIPVPNSSKDSSGQFYVANIDLQAVMQAKTPQWNIKMCPNDVVQVPKARMIYVLGEVLKPGGYVLHQDEHVTAMGALSMAGGSTPFGAPQGARLLRTTEGSTKRDETRIDLRRVLEGKGEDAPMRADDILFLPGNLSKKASLRAIESGIQITTGMIIWRR